MATNTTQTTRWLRAGIIIAAIVVVFAGAVIAWQLGTAPPGGTASQSLQDGTGTTADGDSQSDSAETDTSGGSSTEPAPSAPVAPEPVCEPGTQLVDGQCVRVGGCTQGVSVPTGIDEALVCGGIPANAIPITAPYVITPSENLGCSIVDGSFVCLARESSWAPLPPPSGHRDGYCSGYQLSPNSAGPPQVVCISEAQPWFRGAYPVPVETEMMDYGKNYVQGGVVCNSQENGLTCWDSGTGHGLFLSRESTQSW